MNPMNEPGYEKLADVLQRAFDQAASGKGKERHAQGEPFHEQVMQIGARKFGVGSLLFQAFKKSEESQRLEGQRGVNELLGAIVYLAGAVIAREAADRESAAVTQAPDADADGWIEWHGGECPVPPHMTVECRMRFTDLSLLVGKADKINWSHTGLLAPTEVIAYRVRIHG
jgi:hypothetical protein